MSEDPLRIADFGPYTQEGQAPGDPANTTAPPLSQMESEVDFIAENNFANTIRLYTTDDQQASLINYAIEQDGLNVIPSVYLSNPNASPSDTTPATWSTISNNTTVMSELNNLVTTLESLPTADFSNIPFIVIGNEEISQVGGWSDTDIEDAIEYVTGQLQQSLPASTYAQLKFTTAETYDGQYMVLWNNPNFTQTFDYSYNPTNSSYYTSSNLGNSSDINIIFANIFGYWDGISASNAATYVDTIYQKLQALYPGKEIVISETGWPSSGATISSPIFTNPQQAAVPSIGNEQTFWQSFLQIANQQKIPFGAFEAFDEPAKDATNSGDAENHWGLISTNTGTTYTGSIFKTSITSLEVSCFLHGTNIATPHGERAVEALLPGDLVLTISGAACPIAWIGRRRIDARHLRHPANVWPVRVRAGAFGDAMPHRDLWLSPDHSVFVDDVLIPIKHLINGKNIVQVPVDELTYYHVELPHHNVLLAEGLPAESYLDTGNGSNFANTEGSIRLFPDFSTHVANESDRWEAYGFAPLIVTGPPLDAVRAHVNSRVTSYGWTEEANHAVS